MFSPHTHTHTLREVQGLKRCTDPYAAPAWRRGSGVESESVMEMTQVRFLLYQSRVVECERLRDTVDLLVSFCYFCLICEMMPMLSELFDCVVHGDETQ